MRLLGAIIPKIHRETQRSVALSSAVVHQFLWTRHFFSSPHTYFPALFSLSRTQPPPSFNSSRVFALLRAKFFFGYLKRATFIIWYGGYMLQRWLLYNWNVASAIKLLNEQYEISIPKIGQDALDHRPTFLYSFSTQRDVTREHIFGMLLSSQSISNQLM